MGQSLGHEKNYNFNCENNDKDYIYLCKEKN